MNDRRVIEIIALLSMEDTPLHRDAITLLQGFRNEAAALRGLVEDAIEQVESVPKRQRLYAELDHLYKHYGDG